MNQPQAGDAELGRQALSLASELLALDADTRAARLAELSAQNPMLAREVDTLLGHVDEADLAPNGSDSLVHHEVPEERIGPWRLIERIGHGGMGEVFRAERADGAYQLQVALKRIWFAPLAERFHAERQLLARLRHPNIAQLLDGGTGENGYPWFVMELVEGQPITQWCDARKLDVAARAKLFAQLCDAVAFAHRNLVIHRDIKPGNVLVDGEGRVKLLDFGIAKLMAEDEVETASTVGFTPAWAAPEQQRGEVVTTASDVYQLGLLLRVLLCGLPAVSLAAREQKMSASVAAQMQESADEANRLARARGLADGERLRKRLAGDLDAIVLRATQPDPAARYSSASELAEDLNRWASHRPLRATHAPWWKRTGKFIKRNQGTVLTATALGIGLVVTTLMALEYARQANLQRDVAVAEAARMQAMRDYLQLMFRDVGRDEHAEVRDVLQHAAKRLSQQFQSDPAGGQSAALLLAEFYLNLGDHAAAEPLLQQVLTWPDSAPDDSLRAQAHMRLAVVRQMQGRLDEGFAELARARELLQKSPQRHAVQLNESLITEARLLRSSGKQEEAIATLRRAIEERSKELELDDHDLAGATSELCNSLLMAGTQDEVEPVCRQSLAQFERLGMGDGVSALAVRNSLAVFYARSGKLAEAEAEFQRLLVERERLYGKKSTDYAVILLNLGSVQAMQGRAKEAIVLQRDALEIMKANMSDGPQTLSAEMKLVETLIMLKDMSEAELRLTRVEQALAAQPALQPALGGALAMTRLKLAIGKRDAVRARRYMREVEQSMGASHAAAVEKLKSEVDAL